MKHRMKLAALGLGTLALSVPSSADNYHRGYSDYRTADHSRYYGHDDRRRGRGHRTSQGIDGVRTVFFPEPVDRFGDPVRSRRGNATRFCRNLGLGEAAHATSVNGYVVDILCRRR